MSLLSFKLQFNRLQSLTWILSIKRRTFCLGPVGGANAPRAPPLVTGLWIKVKGSSIPAMVEKFGVHSIDVIQSSITSFPQLTLDMVFVIVIKKRS